MLRPTFLFVSLFLTASTAQALETHPEIPKTPSGLLQCIHPLTPHKAFPRAPGEKLQYDLELFGINLGTASFEIKRRGTFRGVPVTEYRTSVDTASMVDLLTTVEGNAAAIVPDGHFAPVQAASSYVFRNHKEQEFQTYKLHGKKVVSKRNRNGKTSTQQKHFQTPVMDFLTGFYLLRGLSQNTSGCTIVYSGHKAFTLWIQPQRTETISTLFGKQSAHRYRIRYGSNRSKKIKEVLLWLSTDEKRLPLRIEGLTKFHPIAELTSYRNGS